MTTHTIDVVSDVICPWCWIGKRHLTAALEEVAEDGLAFDVRWRPFRLNPDMPPEGRDRAAYRIHKFGSAERSAELDARIVQVGATVGLDFRFDRQPRTPDTLPAHRLLRFAEAVGTASEVKEALFQAYFHDGLDISDRALLDRIGAAQGVGDVAARLAGDEALAQIEAEDLAARQGGVNGVPTFLLDRHVLVSGAVPGSELAGLLRRGVAILRSRADAA